MKRNNHPSILTVEDTIQEFLNLNNSEKRVAAAFIQGLMSRSTTPTEDERKSA